MFEQGQSLSSMSYGSHFGEACSDVSYLAKFNTAVSVGNGRVKARVTPMTSETRNGM